MHLLRGNAIPAGSAILTILSVAEIFLGPFSCANFNIICRL